LEDDGDIDTYKLIDLAEDIDGGDLMASTTTQDPEGTVVTDYYTIFWAARLIAIALELPADITLFLNSGVSFPVVEAGQKRFKSRVVARS
jgi:hypothetical protein